MYKNFKIISLFLAVLCFASAALAQETTGSIEITTKDSTGAVVPGVTVTVTNATGTSGFKRTVTTGDNGFQRILQVPPGKYNIKSEPISVGAKPTRMLWLF
ncbi:MAG: carboxypeptidase regulatory-like domain-containing protein [Pyrinomonadaceae bacterium]